MGQEPNEYTVRKSPSESYLQDTFVGSIPHLVLPTFATFLELVVATNSYCSLFLLSESASHKLSAVQLTPGLSTTTA